MLYKTLVILGCGLAQASYARIAGYEPASQVTDHNAIDLDQAAMETFLGLKTAAGFANAKLAYEQGGNSKVYVEYVVSTLGQDFAKSLKVTGATSAVIAKLKDKAETGDAKLNVQYATTDNQASYVACKPDMLPAVATGITTDCLEGTYTADTRTTEALTLDTNPTTTITPISGTTKAGRTLAGFSTGIAKKALHTCPGCPYKEMLMFYNYYGSATYGDDWIQAAFGQTATSWTNGNMDFTGASFDTREQAVKKGSAYMNVWMYVMREFEDAIDDCVKGTSLVLSNDDPVHAWDEGVAFYSGSLTGTDATTSSGKLVFALAEKRCGDFKTCGTTGDKSTGTSKVNYDLSQAFAAGKHALLSGYCLAARPHVERIADIMTIPLIQGTLRYAFKMDKYGDTAPNPSCTDKCKAEGATFAAAVLPRIHYCSASAATTIYNNVKLGAASTTYSDVKGAFESVYSCLNITCIDVGGLLEVITVGAESYFSGAEPCNDAVPPPSAPPSPPTPFVEKEVEKEKMPGYAVAIILITALMCVVFSGCFCYLVMREKAGKPIFLNLSKGGSA